MRKFFILLTFLLIYCSESPTQNQNPIIDEGNRSDALEFSLQSLSHGTQTLSQYNGKVVYLFFLGYNCPPCIGNAPATQSQIANKYGDDVQVLGLDVWNGSTGNLTNFQVQTGVTYPLLLNASSVGSDYKAYNDYSVVIDQNGKIAYRGGNVSIPDIQSTIDSLLSK